MRKIKKCKLIHPKEINNKKYHKLEVKNMSMIAVPRDEIIIVNGTKLNKYLEETKDKRISNRKRVKRLSKLIESRISTGDNI